MIYKEVKAGRETDLLVAEKIMGWKWRAFKASHSDPVRWVRDIYPPDAIELTWRDPKDAPPLKALPYDKSANYLGRLPHYSTDIADANRVIVKVTDRDRFEPEIVEIRGPWRDGWATRMVWVHHDGDIPMTEWIGAETLPLAICRMALVRNRHREKLV